MPNYEIAIYGTHILVSNENYSDNKLFFGEKCIASKTRTLQDGAGGIEWEWLEEEEAATVGFCLPSMQGRRSADSFGAVQR